MAGHAGIISEKQIIFYTWQIPAAGTKAPAGRGRIRFAGAAPSGVI